MTATGPEASTLSRLVAPAPWAVTSWEPTRRSPGCWASPREGLARRDRCDGPHSRGLGRLLDASGAAEPERARVEAPDRRDGRLPLGPALDVFGDGPHDVRRRVDACGVMELHRRCVLEIRKG